MKKDWETKIKSSQTKTVKMPFKSPDSQVFVYNDLCGSSVTDSTAAFVMAERLAKQSLTDSHIHTAMEDAQAKQEMHNMATRNKGIGNY